MKLEVHASLYSESDAINATGCRVKPKVLQSWMLDGCLSTPLISAGSSPQLFWFGNVLEIEIMSLAIERGVSLEALKKTGSSYLGRAVALDTDLHMMLFWGDLSVQATTEIVSMSPTGNKNWDDVIEEKISHNGVVIIIDVSQRIDVLEDRLERRLATRRETSEAVYPNLRDKLIELRQSHLADQQVAEKIMSFA